MSVRAAKFSQADVSRLFKAAKAAGERVRVEIHPDGKLTATPIQINNEATEDPNEWDEGGAK